MDSIDKHMVRKVQLCCQTAVVAAIGLQRRISCFGKPLLSRGCFCIG
ncbi:hypothetical protein JI435_411510 [Parastagonospora nodorum SN15]|uniref:Uncharacterized protein n=1 Tax=Phaeosphaeria nodorum (strain SN15 / ATCC MYA-4574 / FGSC 10173) TaxID=321614 RepID=A0A7U2I183_PHANO|nr:hypothetical protein JI435_411510 [Parastagonospora nodorum SN15]